MIHPTAIVAEDVVLGENVRIGAYAVVQSQVTIGSNTRIGNHAVICSHTSVGSNNHIHEFAVLGGEPQSIHYRGEATELTIGNHNTIREFVTISRGTAGGERVTRIADDNMIMAYSHVAHDCQIGSNCVFANGTNLAGHVSVGDFAFLGGFTLVHQNCRIGAHCMTGISTIIRQDVSPYVTVNGNPPSAVCVNSRGLARREFSQVSINRLKKVFKLYFREKRTLGQINAEIDNEIKRDHHVSDLIQFIDSSSRGVIR